MKTLTLMRHAKSSWKDAGLNDLDRPLIQKGLSRTRLIIDHLKDKDFKPEYIITSNAVRAMETARIMAHAFGIAEEFVRVEKLMYTADADNFFDHCFDLPEKVTHTLIVGHNPAITNFANFFLKQKIDYLPTSGIVRIDFSTDKWEDIPISGGKVSLMVYPKMLR